MTVKRRGAVPNEHEIVDEATMALIFTRPDGSVRRSLYDLADHDLAAAHRWYLGEYLMCTRGGRGARKTIYLHREIAGLRPGDREIVDHINGNRLDNRKANLRIADWRTNNHNRAVLSSRGTSRYRGVAWDQARGLWMAYVRIDRRNRNVGRFTTEEEAAEAIARFRHEQGLPAGY